MLTGLRILKIHNIGCTLAKVKHAILYVLIITSTAGNEY